MDRYAESLRDALNEVASPEVSISEFSPPPRRVRLPRRLDRYWSHYPSYLLHARRTRFDVNHVLDHAYGQLTYALEPERTIVTCHDLHPWQRWRGTVAGLPRRRVPPVTFQVSLAGLRRARLIVAVSQATKDQLVEILGIDPGRVQVAPNGVDPIFSAAQEPRKRSEQATILCVSTGTPYKNHRAVVEVFARVADRSERQVRLVRVGPPLPAEEAERLRGHRLSDRVVELGSVSERTLSDTYRSSDVLLHPSFYEGFGWPPLEAMASGLPVVTSTWASLTEVTDGAALHADPLDYDGLADCVLRIIEDRRVADELRDRGLCRARLFTWERAAKRVVALYRTILNESGSFAA
jgi:glycosyltransferase involved in cell wall biosynthesis